MDKWKSELKEAFKAPYPTRKRSFLRQIGLQKMPVHKFLFSQIGYIRKWVWCVSAIVFILSVLAAAFLPNTVLWFISGITPLLALTICSESGRSELYNMAELEMATRFSLRSVILARLAILGLMNLLILGVLLLIGLFSDTVTPWAAALYIVTPFLLSAFTGLYVVRKFKGQGGMYACIGASVFISVFLFASHYTIPFIYQEWCLSAWIIATLILLFTSGKQCIAMIKQTEELSWNLS